MESIREQVFKMSEQELKDLNHIVVARLKNMHEAKEIMAVRKFFTGDRVSFESKNKIFGGRITIVIDKIRGTRIHGHEEKNCGMKWSVSPSICRLEPHGQTDKEV